MTTTSEPIPPVEKARRTDNDLGFGSVVAREIRGRFLNRDGSFNVRREGLGFWSSVHPYHFLVNISWPRLLVLVTAGFVVVNSLFAVMYFLLGPDALAGIRISERGPLRFADCFFFSVETLSTIGYGHIYPSSFAANVVVVAEALVGFLAVALAAGIVFARFSRPQAKIIFSEHAIIAPYRNGSALMFRIANQKKTQLLNLECKVMFVGKNVERVSRRDFIMLDLERTSVTFFPLSWTIVHPITETSPLWGCGVEDLKRSDAEFLILLTGFDETSSQIVHARSSYKADELIVGARFRNIFNPPDDDGKLSVRIDELHEIEPALLP